ncbi:MAG TPA: methionyl-tRNA formyltransferase [Terriglobales bacterium]|nr:methionyl-tRNA formyltransferase [Terriglobales bacterium]
MDLIFCGTPQFAVPTLQALAAAGEFRIRLVVTQPDRPAGRGMEVAAPPVKRVAQELGLPVVQPDKIKNNTDFRAQLEAIAPRAIVVVGYGRIIPQWMIDLPPLGNINLHGSLLPKYRGAAPVQWAIAMGETETGVTTMRIDAGLDTGDILLQKTLAIGAQDTADTVGPRLAALGAPLMVETLRGLDTGRITPRPQDHAQASLAPILKKEDGVIDWNRNAAEIGNRLRGFQPWPGAHTTFRGKALNLWLAAPARFGEGVAAAVQGLAPGQIQASGDWLFAGCGGGTVLKIEILQPEGKKRMSARDFVNGYRPKAGERLGG